MLPKSESFCFLHYSLGQETNFLILKQSELIIQIGDRLMFPDLIALFDFADQQRRFGIMELVVFQDDILIKVGITVAAKMQTAVVGPNVIAQQTVTPFSGFR